MTSPDSEFETFARAALPQYGLACDAPLTLLNVSENATFRIDSPGERSVLRVHRTGYHTADAIQSELAWVSALREEGVVRTPAFVAAESGDGVVVARREDGQERYVVRFDWVEGHEPEEAHLAREFEQLGAITARLHAHARQWQAPPGFSRFTWDYDTALGPRGHWGRWQDGLGVGTAEEEVLGACAAVLRDRLARWGKGRDRFGLVHADMRLANLLVDGSEVTVIDFDDCGWGWYLYDLGSSLSFIEHEPYVPELIDSWVRGYRTIAELSEAEEAEIPTFVMLRRLLLVAWIGSHSATETAQQMGPQYTLDSCRLAEEYLSRMTKA